MLRLIFSSIVVTIISTSGASTTSTASASESTVAISSVAAIIVPSVVSAGAITAPVIPTAPFASFLIEVAVSAAVWPTVIKIISTSAVPIEVVSSVIVVTVASVATLSIVLSTSSAGASLIVEATAATTVRHATSTSTLRTSPLGEATAIVLLLLGDVDPEGGRAVVQHNQPVQVERLLQLVQRAELDVAEALEDVRFLVLDQANVFHRKVLEYPVEVALDDALGQVADVRDVRRLRRQRSASPLTTISIIIMSTSACHICF